MFHHSHSSNQIKNWNSATPLDYFRDKSHFTYKEGSQIVVGVSCREWEKGSSLINSRRMEDSSQHIRTDALLHTNRITSLFSHWHNTIDDFPYTQSTLYTFIYTFILYKYAIQFFHVSLSWEERTFSLYLFAYSLLYSFDYFI